MHIPVVMITALSDIEDRVNGLESGADEFLTKPVNDVALFARVRSLSRTKSIIDELKLRNQINAELGCRVVEFVDSFFDNKIVIIDDDIIQAKNITKTLSTLTSHVTIIHSAEEIEALVSQILPDIIIISCQMENTDPLRITSALRAMDALKHSPIMFLSEEEDMAIVVRGLELGANDYFLYPLDDNELLARIKTQLRRKKYQDELRHNLEQSVNLSIKDGLTGIYNRRYFDMHITQLALKSIGASTSFYLLMLDIDYFKLINDKYGHQAGDEALKKIVNVLRDQIRVTDLLARYGGEEFAIILCDMEIEFALSVAERLRRAIERIEFHVSGVIEPFHRTISIGMAAFDGAESVTRLIERADKALYSAKASGRNKIVIADSL
jgi:two-component system cell cycle response regulator